MDNVIHHITVYLDTYQYRNEYHVDEIAVQIEISTSLVKQVQLFIKLKIIKINK